VVQGGGIIDDCRTASEEETIRPRQDHSTTRSTPRSGFVQLGGCTRGSSTFRATAAIISWMRQSTGSSSIIWIRSTRNDGSPVPAN